MSSGWPRAKLAWLPVLVAPALAVRLVHLSEQILGGDELHLLQVIDRHSPLEILGLVTDTDFSIPLALVARLVSGVLPLSEMLLRAPFLVLGALVPLLFFFVVRRWVGDVAAFLVLLVATVHPLLIFYSRFVRPYGPGMVLVFGVFALLDRYRVRGGKGALSLAAVLGALAAWIQLPALSAVGACFLAALVRGRMVEPLRPASSATRRAALPVVLAGGACLVLTILLYFPALPGLREHVLEGNIGQGALSGDVLSRNGAVLAGWPGLPGIVVGGALFVFGSVVLARRNPALAIFLVLPVLLHGTALLLLKPRLVQFSFVLARYLLPLLPLVLVVACVGLEAVLRRLASILPRPTFLTEGGVVALLGALLAATWLVAGPVPAIYREGRAYAHHNDYQTFRFLTDPLWQEAMEAKAASVQAFYRELESGREILECPPPGSFYDNVLVSYQHLHGRAMRLVAPRESFWASERLALRNVVVAGLDDKGWSTVEPGTVILLHRQVVAEIPAVTGHPPSREAAHVYGPEVVEALRKEIEAVCGEPFLRDAAVDLYRVPEKGGA